MPKISPLQQNKSQVLDSPSKERPPRYVVWMLNDHFTPMDFVVDILSQVFHFDEPTSTALMWEIHTKGKANCGVFSYDIATTKVRKVAELAVTAGHPLQCTIEKQDTPTYEN